MRMLDEGGTKKATLCARWAKWAQGMIRASPLRLAANRRLSAPWSSSITMSWRPRSNAWTTWSGPNGRTTSASS